MQHNCSLKNLNLSAADHPLSLKILWMIELNFRANLLLKSHKELDCTNYALISEIWCNINPIPTEGGPFGPEQPKTVWHFHSFMTGVTKIHDFVCFSICLVPVKLFWEKKLWNFEKLKKNILTFSTPKGPPFGKKMIFFNLSKFQNFFSQNSFTGTKQILKQTKSWILVTPVIKLWKYQTVLDC